MCIEATCSLFLTWLGEVADTLQVSDDTCHIVHILGMAVRTFLQVTLVDMSTVVAYGIGDIEREVVTSLLGSDLQQVGILLLAEVLLQVHMQCGTTSEVLDIGSAM
jgi:hypothetical protein